MTLPTGAHGSPTAAVDLVAATAGDAEAFHRLTQPSLRELHLHCYRMLSSIHDAEDARQETLLRAWRHLASFEGRSSFRAWLYRIATNVCLATLDKSQPPTGEQAVLTPYPDDWLDKLPSEAAEPGARYDLRESVQFALLAAIQTLPPRQRAALL